MNTVKRSPAFKIAVTALCAALNITGAFLALVLRLPIYLDSVGTILNAFILGPVFGPLTALISSVISYFTSDPFALAFMPGGMLTGLIAGLVFRAGMLSGKKLPLGTLIATVPGTIYSACTAAYLFGGNTSSGSSILVQVLSKMGMNLVAAAFAVQFVTDYADRLISVAVSTALAKRINKMRF